MNRLIRYPMCVIALGAILTLPVSALGGDDAPHRPRPAKFALNTHAVVAVPVGGGQVRAVDLSGDGRAHATRRAVRLHFGEMTGRADGIIARIRWDNPLDRDGNNFHGQGVAKVTVGDRTVLYRLSVRGHIEHTDRGAVMVGKFHATGGTADARFFGSFRGPKIAPNDNGDDDS